MAIYSCQHGVTLRGQFRAHYARSCLSKIVWHERCGWGQCASDAYPPNSHNPFYSCLVSVTHFLLVYKLPLILDILHISMERRWLAYNEISRTTGPNIGLFVLILMHFPNSKFPIPIREWKRARSPSFDSGSDTIWMWGYGWTHTLIKGYRFINCPSPRKESLNLVNIFLMSMSSCQLVSYFND